MKNTLNEMHDKQLSVTALLRHELNVISFPALQL